MKTVYVLLAQGVVKISCKSVIVQGDWLTCVGEDSAVMAQFRTPSIFGWNWKDSLVEDEIPSRPTQGLKDANVAA